MSVRLPALSFGALVVGSVIAVDPAGLAPFGPSKWLVVSTLAFVTIALSLRFGTVRCHRPTWWMWVALLGLLTVSALVNDDAKVALLGHPDRHLGVLTWVLFFAMFCAGQQLADQLDHVGTRRRRGRSDPRVVLAVGVAVRPADRRSRRRPAGCSAPSVRRPFSVPRVACSDRSRSASPSIDRRIDGGGGVPSRPRCSWRSPLVGSGTRAAWVGAAVAAVMVVVAARPTLRNVLLCAAGLLVAVAVVAPRLTDVSSRREGGSSRLDEWEVAARVIGHHPLIGVGPEGYRIAVAQGIDDAYETRLPARHRAARPRPLRTARRHVGGRSRSRSAVRRRWSASSVGELAADAVPPAAPGRRRCGVHRLRGPATAAVPAGRARSDLVGASVASS